MEELYTIPKNQEGQELAERGTPLFPCSAYDQDVRQYVSGEISPHWHYEMELFLLIEGTAHVSFTDGEADLKPGDGFFANSGVLHGISTFSNGPCRYHSMVFDPAILSGASGSAFDVLYLRPFIQQGVPHWIFRQEDSGQEGNFSQLFAAAFHACTQGNYGYEFVIREQLSKIFLILNVCPGDGRSKRKSQQEMRIKQMLSWLDEHYAEPVAVSALAKATGVCVRECQRTFSNSLHMSPMQYLNQRRIVQATKLLISTGKPVSEVALCCGFDNASNFARHFKRITGMSPRAYRQHITEHI